MKKWIVTLAGLISLTSAVQAQDAVSTALGKLDAPRGLCNLLGGTAEQAMKLAEGSEMLVFVQLPDVAEVEKLKKMAADKGLLNARLYVEKGASDKSFIADNSADLVVSADGKIAEAEAMRVVAPCGSFVSGDKVTKKPFPKEMDQWNHWYHAPDNNPVSTDTALKWPFVVQWLDKPYFGAQPRTTIVHNGVIYSATGMSDGGTQAVAEMTLNMNLLEARRAFNGQVLWQRKLKPGYYTSRSAFVATDEAFYMIEDGKGVLALDPLTGKELKTIAVDGVPTNYKWIAVQDGVLYLLAGDADPAPESVEPKGLLYKYPAWNLVFENGKPKTWWGYGNHLAAYDLKGAKKLWSYQHESLIGSRLLAMLDKKLYFAGFEHGAGALDAISGKVLWKNNSPDFLTALNKQGEEKRPHVLGTTRPAMLATPNTVLIQLKELCSGIALSTSDGKMLWSGEAGKSGVSHPMWLDGKLHGLGGIYDAATGAKSGDTFKGGDGCGPVTVSPNGVYRRHSIFWDRARNKGVSDHTFRSGCWQDAVPAHGLLFNTPYVCGCNYSLQGTIAQCSAGDFKWGQKAVESERLETGKASEGSLKVSTKDWVTHRGNNKRNSAAAVPVPDSGVSEVWSVKAEKPTGLTAPSAAGDFVFYADDQGQVLCFDKSGVKKWSFYTGGKIFFAPTITDGRVFVSSADGFAYCLNSDSGEMIWRFRCSPQERRIMAYSHLSSAWPANTGVMVENGVAFVGAGIVSQAGTHIYALDAKTGKLMWENNESGQMDKENLIGAAALGCFTLSKNHVWLAGGNAASPVSYDLKTGAHNAPKAVGDVVSAKWVHSRGDEVANLNETYILTGGRIMYSEQPRRDVKAGLDGTLVPFDSATGKVAEPEVVPTDGRQTLPVWDDKQMFVVLAARNLVECWDTAKAIPHFQEIAKGYTPDKKQKGGKLTFEPLGAIRKLTATEYPMKLWGPIEITADAVALGENAIVVVNQKAPGGKGKKGGGGKKKKGADADEAAPELPTGEWFITAYARADGKEMWEQKLPSEPVDGGLCLTRDGQAVVTFLDGSVKCFGKK